MHLDDERLQRLLHGELDRLESGAARSHLADCDECSRRLAAMEVEEAAVGALLAQLDRPSPRIEAAAVARLASARRPRTWQWAAGIALAVGIAGVAYAIPGSPLPDWLDSLVRWAGGGRPSSTETAPEPAPALSGLSVTPGRTFRIRFASANPSDLVVIALTDGGEVQIRAPRGSAAFTAGENAILVHPTGNAPHGEPGVTYEIQIPRSAPHVEIHLGSDRIFLKEGPRIVARAASSGSGTYRLPLTAR